MFQVGQKVVCVDDSPSHHSHPLKKGSVYTIAGFDLKTIPDKAGILIAGWRHPRVPWHGGLLGFRPERFRPIQERKTDISALQALLNTKSIKELVK